MTSLYALLRPYQQKFFSDKRRFKIACWSRRAGKDFTIAAILCYTALLEGAEGLSLCITTNLRTASELLRLSVKWAKAICALSNGTISFTSNATQITFSTGARVVCLPAGDGTAARGWQINGAVLISEAAFIPRLKELLDGVAPALTTNPRSKLILASTPSGKNHYFYKLWCNALEDEAWCTSKITIEDAIAQGMTADLDDIKKLCPDPQSLATEYYCEFASEWSQFIDFSIVDFQPIPTLFRAKYLGVDVGSQHDMTALCTLGESNGNLYAVDIQIMKKAEYTAQQSKIIALNTQHKYTAGFIDQNGIGAGLAEYVHKSPNCAMIEGFTTTAANKPGMFELLRTKILERKIHFNPTLKTVLENEFARISRIIGNDGKVRYDAERNQDDHCDRTSSILFALQAFKAHQPSATLPCSYQLKSRMF